MDLSILEPPLVRMPHLSSGTWLNTAHPLTRHDWRGRVLLIDFWDYSCVNCLRTLPYLRAWHGRYAAKGLLIIGIHAPEFKFGRNEAQIVQAIQEFELPYPILLDPDYENWTLFANRAWPTKYMIDHRGYIRWQRSGEGYYQAAERALQTLLQLREPSVELPEIMPPLQDEDHSGTVCYRPTPELYAGYQGGGLFGGALGNSEGYVTKGLMMYHLPEVEERREGQFYVNGFWRAWPESLAYVGQDGGQILLPYRGSGVNAVLSPSGDDVELMLNLWGGERDPLIEVKQDGHSLPLHLAGRNVWFDENGRSFLRITRPRMYEIVRDNRYGRYELELIFRSSGLALYAFTFNTCVASDDNIDDSDLFVRH